MQGNGREEVRRKVALTPGIRDGLVIFPSVFEGKEQELWAVRGDVLSSRD